MGFLSTRDWAEYAARYVGCEFETLTIESRSYHLLRQNSTLGTSLSNLIELDIEHSGLRKYLFDEFPSSALQRGIRALHFRVPPSVDLTRTALLRPFLGRGFSVTTGFTSLVDLERSNEQLWSGVRKTYRPLIKGELTRVAFRFCDRAHFEDGVFDDWRRVYGFAVSRGGGVHPAAAFDAVGRAIMDGRGVLVAAYDERAFLGGMVFGHDEGTAYYLSAANADEVEQDRSRYVGHAIMWKAIEYLKETAACRQLEIGPLEFPGQAYCRSTEKQRHITTFKMGFGGAFVPMFYLSSFTTPDGTKGLGHLLAENLCAAVDGDGVV